MLNRRRFLGSVSAALACAGTGDLPRAARANDPRKTPPETSAGSAASESEKADPGAGGRAARLHRESVVIVMHDHNPIDGDVERMLAGGVTAKVYQLLVDVEIGANYRKSADSREGWTQKGLDAIREVRRTIEADPRRLLLAIKAEDFLRAKREGKVAILIGAEGAKLLEGRLETLKTFYELGLRELQLRWAVPNQIVERDTLTSFGIEVVRECQKLGIIVDLTHIPRPAFFEAIDLLEKPPIVSHGTGGGDLNEKSLKALASRRGVLGLHFYSSYLGPKPTVDRVVEQVDAVAQVAGIETIGLGVDFFPTTGAWGEFQRSQGTSDISWAVDDIGQLHRVTEALAARDYSDEDIAKVLGGNFLRLCGEVFGG